MPSGPIDSRPPAAPSRPGLGTLSAVEWASRARTLADLQRLTEAVDAYDAALALSPVEGDWWHRRGTALVGLRRYAAAVESYERALALCPTNVLSINGRGVALEGLARTAEAADCYRRALELQPHYATPHSNLGRLRRDSGDLEGAIASFRSAVRLQPNFVMAHNNLGCALYDSGQMQASIASFRRALELAGTFPECELNLATALLKSGDFAGGWPAFESRWRARPNLSSLVPVELDRWSGASLEGRTLVLVAEQGYGDAIQFCRYAALLNRAGIRPVLQAHPELIVLLESTGYFARVCTQHVRLAAADHVWYPLMSLPLHFGTDAASIPSFRSYLRASPERVARWRERLGPREGLRVGIAWQGNPTTEIASLRGRSMPAQALAPLVRIPGVTWVSLQKGAGAEQLEAAEFRGRVIDRTAELEDFADTAALVANLDLVVTVDTAVAHLAGALGRRVWVALHTASDWRWLESRRDSPWYPTMRLYRQATAGDWEPVASCMRADLDARKFGD